MRFPGKTSIGRTLRRCASINGEPNLAAIVPSTSEAISLSPRRLRLPGLTRIKSAMWAWALSNGITKHYDGGKIHVTSINYNTHVKSIAKMSLPPKPIVNARVTKLSHLPDESVEALGGIIMDCNRPPKMLQSEADDLSGKLEKRHFPATPREVRTARREILDEIFEENPAFIYEWQDTKHRPDLEKELQKQVKKRLAQTRYNWKPLQFKDKEAAVVYALSRFGGHFAEMRRVLAEFDRNDFVPETVLDYGSGIGSSFWAAFERWGNKVREYALMDKDNVMRHFSMDMLRGSNYTGSGDFVTPNVFFRNDIYPSPRHTYDLVILHRTLIELPSPEERYALVEKLWQRTNRFLVIVESPMPDAFKSLIKIRDFVLTAGVAFDLDKTKELLREHGQLDQETIELLASNTVQQYEKYCVAREKLPEEVKIPTRLDPGHVFAPCPHDQACPMLSLKKNASCKFKVRWQEFRADHKTQSKDRDGTLLGEFSFIIMEKGERKPEEKVFPRILELKRAHRCVSCRLCTPFDGIQRLVVSKRAEKIYKRVRRAMPSQLFPINFEIVRSEIDMPKGGDDCRHLTEEKIVSLREVEDPVENVKLIEEKIAQLNS